MGTFGVKRASDEPFCPSTVYAKVQIPVHTRTPSAAEMTPAISDPQALQPRCPTSLQTIF